MSTEPAGDTTRRLSITPKAAAVVVLAVLAAVFVFQNTAKGQVNVFFWTVRMPAWIWLLGVFLTGVVVGSLFPWLRRAGARR